MKRVSLTEPDPPAVDTARNGKHPSNGRFLPGNRLAARRNSRRAWQETFDETFTPADLRAVVRKAVAQAKHGDRYAREWLGQYALQRPPRLLDLRMQEHTPPEDPEEIDPMAF
jgi:hypothetical protein